VQLYSLRRILGFSLSLLALVPALLAAWLLTRASTSSVEEMAQGLLTQVAERIQLATEDHMRQAHVILNGLVSVRMTPAEEAQAREWLRHPAHFEAMAFALVHQTQDVPSVYLGTLLGAYLGMEATPEGVKVARREADGVGRQFFLSGRPGERGRPLAFETDNFEPRTRVWYAGAADAKGRVFSPVRVSMESRQLFVSLSQPVYDIDGGVAGVFGVDLHLKQLADRLRTQRISAHGAAFVVDERGALVASSAGDALFVDVGGGRTERRSPSESSNALIRASFSALQALQALQAQRRSDVVASSQAVLRTTASGETMLMVQRPFGESLGLRWTLVVAAPESDFTAGLMHARSVSLALIGALVLLGTLLAWLIARGIGQRLNRLSEAAGQLGRGEVPVIDHRTHIREVRALSQVLHDSAVLLQGFREQVRSDALALQEANNTLEARVAQRTAELSASREEALAAARAKAAFLATMSHEIRTPLNGVVGMSTLLAETSLDAEQRDYLQTIRISSDQLLSVINDILDFSKIESGKLELESEPFDLRNAVEEACDIAAPRAREKGLELIIDMPAAGPGAVPAAVVGDVTRLRQILINLVNNAVKFTARGEVTVHARQLEGPDPEGRAVIEFRVQDSGIGIPPDRVGSLFEAFSQVDASTTRKYGGTGLGLAICLRLVELMGGRIGVESELGKGSTFWFTMPACATTLPATVSESGASVLRGSRALIVDDHPTNVRILRRQLELWGMEVASADSGGEALTWLASRGVLDSAEAMRSGWLPDVIITDMHMPEMDGVALARALRAGPAWRDIPLVLLSSGFMPSGDESAHLFDARLLKPARQAQLCLTLARCISSDHVVQVASSRPAADPRRNVTVMVADDNAVNLKVATAMLRKLGYDFETAVDGREAVAAVGRSLTQARPFGAILMDVNMPDVDGLDATRQILEAWGDKAPPVIALTAAALPEDQARCLAAGMVDYLTKPLHVASLALALERWVPGPHTPAQGTADRRAEAVILAPLADPATAPLMDFGRLEEFREFDDEDLSLTREVIGMFVVEAPRRLAAIEAALAAYDAPALAAAAHALKGASGNIGASALQSASNLLEEDARQGVPPDAAARLERLQELWSATQAVLANWV